MVTQTTWKTSYNIVMCRLPTERSLKVLLPKLEPHIARRRALARFPDLLRRGARTAKVHANVCPQRRFQASHVCATHDAVAHAAQQLVEVRAAKIGAAV